MFWLKKYNRNSCKISNSGCIDSNFSIKFFLCTEKIPKQFVTITKNHKEMLPGFLSFFEILSFRDFVTEPKVFQIFQVKASLGPIYPRKLGLFEMWNFLPTLPISLNTRPYIWENTYLTLPPLSLGPQYVPVSTSTRKIPNLQFISWRQSVEICGVNWNFHIFPDSKL